MALKWKPESWHEEENFIAKPVTIRGVEYPSQNAAAKALGVSPARVSHAYKAGTLDGVGLGSNKHAARKPIIVDGVRYESSKEASKALGVSVATLSLGRKRGFIYRKLEVKNV